MAKKEAPKDSKDKPLYVKSAVGEYIRTKDLKVSSDLYDKVNEILQGMLDRAAERCKTNNRKTVMPQDL